LEINIFLYFSHLYDNMRKVGLTTFLNVKKMLRNAIITENLNNEACYNEFIKVYIYIYIVNKTIHFKTKL